MDLTKEKSNLTPEVKQIYERIFNFPQSEENNYEKSKLINNKNKENETEDINIYNSEKTNFNDTEEEFNLSNENDNKVETSMVENNLSNSEIKKYEVIKYKNIGNKLFTIQYNNESNSSTNNNSTLSRKRGRPKESDDQREHTKFYPDNIESKIDGLVINSTLIFINSKIDDQNEKLKKLSYEETKKLKINMNKKVKDILINASIKKYKIHNRKIISKYESKLKEIFELPMYKIIQNIFMKEKIDILEGLEEIYFALKTQKLKKENEDYKQSFKEQEIEYLNEKIADYLIINEKTQDNTTNSISNFDNFDLDKSILLNLYSQISPDLTFVEQPNFILNNNDYMVETDQFSFEKIDSYNTNDSYFLYIQSNSSNEVMDEVLPFSECL